MTDKLRSHFEPEYFHAFCTGELIDVGAAKKLALHHLSIHPRVSDRLKTFSRLYLAQLARDECITQSHSPAHRAWLALPDKDKTIFWNVTGDGKDDRAYRHFQRVVIARLRSKDGESRV